MKDFLRQSQTSSRVLFGIWLVAMIFAGYNPEVEHDFIFSRILFCWLLLAPALFVELKKNYDIRKLIPKH